MQAPSPKKSSRRLFRLAYPLYLVLVLLIAGEVTVRIMGYRPWHPAEQSFSVRPEGPFFRPDSLLGYAGRAGRFEATLADTLHFTVTHDSAGFRITSRGPAPDSTARPEIWIFGCSFSHGFGVNDEDTYPWKLQERLPQYRIRNFGVDGYGTLQSLLSLEQELGRREAPAMVILAYGSFHDQRNTSNRYWRKVLHGREVVEGLRYPQIRFDERDSLVTSFSRLEYQPWPLMRFSALSHYLEQGYNQREDDRLRSKEITWRLILRVVETCRARGVSFLLTGIYQHEGTVDMLSELAATGIATLDISHDLEREGLRILPSDGHPNAKSHEMMADKLTSYLHGQLEFPQD